MEQIQPAAKAAHSSTRTSSKKGFVRSGRGGLYIDRTRKLGSLIANEVILREMVRFFRTYYPNGSRGRLLDVGAGTKPYAVVYGEYFDDCTSVDVPTSEHDLDVDYFAPADDLPFEEGSYDCIVCTEVLEHVPDPRKALREFERVLAPGGMVYLTTPFLVPLHEMPYDFFRYTPSALRTMADEAGFDVLSITSRGDYFSMLLSMSLFPISKAWRMLSRLLGVKFYTPKNPFVWLGIVMPQLLYLRYWQSARDGSGPAHRVYRGLDYMTLGYVTVLKKR